MKKCFLLLAFPIIVLFSFSACSKCATCTTLITNKDTGERLPGTEPNIREFCGDELKEVNGRIDDRPQSNGLTYRYITDCD